ncbi:hypothetical protein TNCV_1970571 [Trichonephila clavipes]|uniref:Uncharacterized protein n=1 Tax=Trichonephila clavipes TaxID=2585209 RepID=A0A8X6W4Z7_TRICX|nr:hypothetical protein TNCV_1970571 [Trichonephila clavipes]
MRLEQLMMGAMYKEIVNLEVREVFSELESIRSSLVDSIREDVSKYTDKPIEERAENMVNILNDYVKEVKEKIQEKATPKASTSKAADALDAPCHNEFRGLRSDSVRQVALATTTDQRLQNLVSVAVAVECTMMSIKGGCRCPMTPQNMTLGKDRYGDA